MGRWGLFNGDGAETKAWDGARLFNNHGDGTFVQVAPNHGHVLIILFSVGACARLVTAGCANFLCIHAADMTRCLMSRHRLTSTTR